MLSRPTAKTLKRNSTDGDVNLFKKNYELICRSFFSARSKFRRAVKSLKRNGKESMFHALQELN